MTPTYDAVDLTGAQRVVYWLLWRTQWLVGSRLATNYLRRHTRVHH
ncbi:hypothetical protein [Mycolicibacterium sp. XJ1904]